MLKVNFKPIWPEAIGALSLLSGPGMGRDFAPTPRCGDARRRLVRGAQARVGCLGLAIASADEAAVDLVFDEQALRDWHLEDRLAKLRQSERRFQSDGDDQQSKLQELAALQKSPERLVVHSYEAQLLALFCEIPDLAQKHSREFVDVFLSCFERDDVIPDKADEAPEFFNADETSKDRKARLLAWLALLAEFSNPKALYRAQDLDSQFRTLLAFPNAAAIQKLAPEEQEDDDDEADADDEEEPEGMHLAPTRHQAIHLLLPAGSRN